jgi:hypothetical protein
MITASHRIIRFTQEFLLASAEQPVQSLWKRGITRLLTPIIRWHGSSKGYGYSATWTVAAESDAPESASTEPLSG